MKRGLKFQEHPFPGAIGKIATLIWKWFAKSLEAIVFFLVRKFYVNVHFVVHNKAKVRAVFIPFFASTNYFYGMRGVGQGEYEAYLANVDYDNVMQALTIETVEWDTVNMGHESFDAKDNKYLPNLETLSAIY